MYVLTICRIRRQTIVMLRVRLWREGYCRACNATLSSFAVPPGLMISRPCCTSHQSSQSSAIPRVPCDLFHAFSHPFCDVTTVWRRRSSTPSLPIHFPLAVTHTSPAHTRRLWLCGQEEAYFAAHNTSVKLSVCKGRAYSVSHPNEGKSKISVNWR